MTYYNWEKIVVSYSGIELKRIHRENYKEPEEKVKAVVGELIKRGLLNSEEKYKPEPTLEECIINISKISNTEPNYKRSKNTIMLLKVVLILDIISISSSFLQYILLDSLKGVVFITEEMVFNNNIRELIIFIIYFIVYILAVILFLLWFTRAYHNLHKRISRCEHPTWWAAAGWFIPFISLFRPYNIMNELIKTTKLIIEHRGINLVKNKNNYYVGLWWSICLITQIISRNLFKTIINQDTIENNIYITIGNIILSCIDIVFIILTIRIVKKLAENEELLYRDEIKITPNRVDRQISLPVV